jgi:hypothetical protein
MIKIDKNVYYEICKFMKFEHTVSIKASRNYFKVICRDIMMKIKL